MKLSGSQSMQLFPSAGVGYLAIPGIGSGLQSQDTTVNITEAQGSFVGGFNHMAGVKLALRGKVEKIDNAFHVGFYPQLTTPFT